MCSPSHYYLGVHSHRGLTISHTHTHTTYTQESKYSAVIKMPSTEFQRISRDITQFGDSMVISCTKEGVQFASASTATEGSAKITLKQGAAMDKKNEGVSVLA